MILTYRYRLLPSKRQHMALAAILASQRILYNAALEERIDAYRKAAKSISYIDQTKSLTVCRHDLPEMGALPVNLQRWTLKRLDDAFQAFFRRVKARNGSAGFPRFRGAGRWQSFGFREFSGIQFDGKRLHFAGLPGGLRVHLHRPLIGKIKSCVFSRDNGGWHVCFQVGVKTTEKRPIETAIGIDLGLNVFAYANDGVAIPNPHIARRAEKELRRRQRALARCKRDSNRRKKVRVKVTRLHRKIADTRNTWLHQRSAALIKRADLIVAEDLRVANMVKNPHLARSISDAGWSKFLAMVAYKAEKAGGYFITVDPRNTSQRCSGCGELVPKSLAVRIHICPHCGLVMDRDYNASLNIIAAVMRRGQLNVTCWGEHAARNISLKEVSN
jgi:putative transposase